MLLKILIVLGGIIIIGAMVYDRFTGKKYTRKVFFVLGGGIILVICAIAARGFL